MSTAQMHEKIQKKYPNRYDIPATHHINLQVKNVLDGLKAEEAKSKKYAEEAERKREEDVQRKKVDEAQIRGSVLPNRGGEGAAVHEANNDVSMVECGRGHEDISEGREDMAEQDSRLEEQATNGAAGGAAIGIDTMTVPAASPSAEGGTAICIDTMTVPVASDSQSAYRREHGEGDGNDAIRAPTGRGRERGRGRGRVRGRGTSTAGIRKPQYRMPTKYS